VFHDDQHGTAIVTLSALQNALTVVKKDITKIKIVLSGAGAAGIAIAKLLLKAGAHNIILCDSRGALSSERQDMDASKMAVFQITNPKNVSGPLQEVLRKADVFIGVSVPDLLTAQDISRMNIHPIVFAMANPVPEIMPDEAAKGGAAIIATGRSDFPNQVNNVLAFPGVFRGALDAGAKEISQEMNIAAAKALAGMVAKPTSTKILPDIFEPGVSEKVAEAIRNVYNKST
jgi:malate dehydrogenase (oxaloacetate-decarboxylating)